MGFGVWGLGFRVCPHLPPTSPPPPHPPAYLTQLPVQGLGLAAWLRDHGTSCRNFAGKLQPLHFPPLFTPPKTLKRGGGGGGRVGRWRTAPPARRKRIDQKRFSTGGCLCCNLTPTPTVRSLYPPIPTTRPPTPEPWFRCRV